ncbi:MAG: Na/Pi cotransporter family protein [Ruminococcaceae bacterium]|nr:Na/Pi cotransporter family protein [Oscillospiraceae bacterium]
MMTTVLTLISLLGGLAMFLYGMEVMGDGLKQGSGAALKNVLGKLTQNTFLGLLTGTLVTAVIQSSTATIVLTVGLIGAGILNLKQGVSIVLGANIGTTVTAQIIRLMDIEASGGSLLNFFKPDTLAPIALIIGIILFMFLKKAASKNVGMICLGFGILFTGLMLMTDAVEPLADSDAFINTLAYFKDMPVLGIFTGLILTVIVQSSSAMVGILQALSSTGELTFQVVYPIIMGINLGTCVTTAMVCSIGSSKDAKRTGIVHIVFNTVGTILFMIVMSLLMHFGAFGGLWDSIVDSGAIANFQTLFNLITAIVLLPFTGLLVKISCKFVKDDPAKDNPYPELDTLDRNLMISPAVAIGEVAHSVAAMARVAELNVARSIEQFKDYQAKRAEEINVAEEHLDQFADKADNYLIELSGKVQAEREERQLTVLMQCIPNIERLGDYATNFDEMAAGLHESGKSFSDNAQKELEILTGAVQEIIHLTVEMLGQESESIAYRIEPLEEVIDDMVVMLRNRHTARLRQGVCSISSGLVFLDLLTHLERAADQCSSIAMLFLSTNNEEIMKSHHHYLEQLHNSNDQPYLEEQERRRQEFLMPLTEIQY